MVEGRGVVVLVAEYLRLDLLDPPAATKFASANLGEGSGRE